MKCFFLGLLVSTASLASVSYHCTNDWTVTVAGTAAKPVIRISYPVNRGAVNISSSQEWPVDADPELLVPNPIAFVSFAYPSGQMYVAAEGDTNEQGFTFIAEEGMLNGARTFKAASNYWTEWGETENDYAHFTCARK